MTDYLPASIHQDPWQAARQWQFYAVRLCKGGHRIGALLHLEGERDEDGCLVEDERLVAVINGVEESVTDEWPTFWPYRPTTEEDYLYLAALAKWARAHDPRHAILNPSVPQTSSETECF